MLENLWCLKKHKNTSSVTFCNLRQNIARCCSKVYFWPPHKFTTQDTKSWNQHLCCTNNIRNLHLLVFVVPAEKRLRSCWARSSRQAWHNFFLAVRDLIVTLQVTDWLLLSLQSSAGKTIYSIKLAIDNWLYLRHLAARPCPALLSLRSNPPVQGPQRLPCKWNRFHCSGQNPKNPS